MARILLCLLLIAIACCGGTLADVAVSRSLVADEESTNSLVAAAEAMKDSKDKAPENHGNFTEDSKDKALKSQGNSTAAVEAKKEKNAKLKKGFLIAAASTAIAGAGFSLAFLGKFLHSLATGKEMGKGWLASGIVGDILHMFSSIFSWIFMLLEFLPKL